MKVLQVRYGYIFLYLRHSWHHFVGGFLQICQSRYVKDLSKFIYINSLAKIRYQIFNTKLYYFLFNKKHDCSLSQEVENERSKDLRMATDLVRGAGTEEGENN